MVFGVVSVILFSASAQADVFNMGGTRDPTTGTWTGEASLAVRHRGQSGQRGGYQVMSDGTTGYGSVPYTYQMGKYDVTVGPVLRSFSTPWPRRTPMACTTATWR